MSKELYGAAYIRVSTHMQEELSPDAQKKLILERAKADNILIPPEYIYLEKGISGKRADRRPEFQRMIATAKQKPSPFSAIYVWKFSRFARNQEESILYKGLLRKQCGVEVISVSEPLIDGPFGSLIERIIEWMDEYYSIRLSGEVTRGMMEKAQRGGYLARPPLGYRIEQSKQPPVVVEDEARIVRLIFDKYVNDGMSLFQLARFLNARGLKTSHGKSFEPRGLEYIIQNPVYCGYVRWNRTCNETKEVKDQEEWIVRKGSHQPIISEEIFQAAQKRWESEYHPRGARPSATYKHWLSGLVKCPYCGRTMIVKKVNNYTYFVCYGYSKGKCQKSTLVNSKVLEPEVLKAIQAASQETFLDFQIRPSIQAETDSELALLQSQLDKLDVKEQRIKEAYRNGIDTLKEYKENKEILAKELDDLRERLENLQKVPDPDALAPVMQERLHNVYEILSSNSFSDQQKSEALRSVVEKIVWHREEQLAEVFYYYVDFFQPVSPGKKKRRESP